MRVPDSISTVDDLTLSQDNDRTQASPREIECTTGISRSSVCRISNNYMIFRVFMQKRVQVLLPISKQKRLTCCQNLLVIYTHIEAARNWFSDEKIFPLAAPNRIAFFHKEIVTTNTLWSLFFHFKFHETRIHYLTRYGSLPRSMFCYQVSQ